jgi:hypothetical protein
VRHAYVEAWLRLVYRTQVKSGVLRLVIKTLRSTLQRAWCAHGGVSCALGTRHTSSRSSGVGSLKCLLPRARMRLRPDSRYTCAV